MKRVLLIAAGLGVVALLVWGFAIGRRERAGEAAREEPVNAPSRVSVHDHETIVSLDLAAQKTSGIVVTPLQAATHSPEQRAFAQVLEMHVWSDSRTAYITAKGESDAARAHAEESRRDLARAKMLQSGSNVSVETVQEAEVKARADEATVQPADAKLHLLESTMREQWGGTLANLLIAGSPELDDLLAQRSLLVEIILPAGIQFSQPPPTAKIQISSDHAVDAKFVSQAARLDPRLQGFVLFYLAPAGNGLTPGLTTTALLPRTETATGVVVPADAVVWSQGKPWVYVQTDPQHFARRPIATELPMENGWFVTTGLVPGDRLVTQGAQQLLSEESRSQIQTGS